MSMIDRLEPRRLMAADAYVNTKGTLFVNGTDKADAVLIAKVDGGYQVTIRTDGGAATTFSGFSAKRVSQIRLDVGEGDDRVTVESDVNEAATLLGGAGDDRIDLFSGASVLVEGGSGKDRIRHDTTDATPGATVVSDTAGGAQWFYLGGRAILRGGSGDDVITAGSPGDEIDGGQGANDRVLLRPGIGYTLKANVITSVPVISSGAYPFVWTTNGTLVRVGTPAIVEDATGSRTFTYYTVGSFTDVRLARVERIEGTVAVDA
jgi:hypothetical protein